MKLLVGTLALVIASFTVCALANEEEEIYSSKYDHLDTDAILKNDRLRNQYVYCFLDTKPCVTPDAIFFKGTFLDYAFNLIF